MPVKNQSTREKYIISTRETEFEPVKKSEKSAHEKKSGRERTPKNGSETVFFDFFAREKILKRCQKWLSRAFLSYTEKKKNTAQNT